MLEMADEKVSLHDFVDLIRGGSETGYIEVRCPRQTPGMESHGRRFLDVDAGLAPVVDAVHYFDALPDALTCIAPGIRAEPGSGAPSNVAEINVLWADLDWKDYPGGREQARDALRAFPHRPHCIIRSGRGYHAYWALREPWGMENGARMEARSLLRRIAIRLGGDLALAQIGAILRAPGTLNHKVDPPVRAEIVVWDMSAPRLHADDFDVLPDEEADTTPGDNADAVGQMVRAWDLHPGAIVLDTLRVTKATSALIQYGAPPGSDESSIAQSVITALIRAGYEPAAIRSVFAASTNGIGNAWLKRGRNGDRWLALSIIKTQQWLQTQENPPPAEQPGNTISKGQGWASENIMDALARDIAPPPMLIEGMLRQGALSAIVSDAGVGKSWLADIVGFHLATGKDIWGRAVPEPLSVLVIQEEMSDADTIDRLRKIRLSVPVSDRDLRLVEFRHVYQPGFLLDTPAPLVDVLGTQPFDVVIVDNFAAVCGNVDENDNNAVAKVLQKLKQEVCIRFNTHVIFIHHTRKVQGGKDSFDAANMYRGAAAFKAALDNMWVLERDKEQTWIKLHFAKCRGFRTPDKPMLLKLVDTDAGGVEMILVDTNGLPVTTVRHSPDEVRSFVIEEMKGGYLTVDAAVAGCMAESGMSQHEVIGVFNRLTALSTCPWVVRDGHIVPQGVL